jgi:hypothetical protein
LLTLLSAFFAGRWLLIDTNEKCIIVDNTVLEEEGRKETADLGVLCGA